MKLHEGDDVMVVFRDCPMVVTQQGPLWHPLRAVFKGYIVDAGKRLGIEVQTTFDRTQHTTHIMFDRILFWGVASPIEQARQLTLTGVRDD